MATNNHFQFPQFTSRSTKQIQNIMKSKKIKARKKFKTLQKTNLKGYNNKKTKSLLFASRMIRSAATKPHQSSKSGIVFFW